MRSYICIQFIMDWTIWTIYTRTTKVVIQVWDIKNRLLLEKGKAELITSYSHLCVESNYLSLFYSTAHPSQNYRPYNIFQELMSVHVKPMLPAYTSISNSEIKVSASVSVVDIA